MGRSHWVGGKACIMGTQMKGDIGGREEEQGEEKEEGNNEKVGGSGEKCTGEGKKVWRYR